MQNLLGKLANRGSSLHENIHDGSLSIGPQNVKPNELVHIRKCKNSRIQLSPFLVCPKVIIEECENCKVIVGKQVRVISSSLEIIKCKNSMFHLDDVQIRTIQCDTTERSAIQFSPPSSVGNVKFVWSDDCKQNVVELNVEHEEGKKDQICSLPVVFPTTSTEASTSDNTPNFTKSGQFRSYISNDFKLITEELIREGSGYTTTVSQKMKDDERDKKINQKLTEYLMNQLLFHEKHGNLTKKDKGNISQSSKNLNSSQNAAMEAVEAFEKADKKMKEQKSSIFQDITAKNIKLKPTETVVRSLSDLVGEDITNTRDPKPVQEAVKEYLDDDEKIEKSAQIVADFIKNSKHCVIYTGAGISTSAKIPDYRGPQGVWTLMEQGKKAAEFNLEQAFPTYAHYAIRELVKRGLVKYVTSTNVDGLHRRSGIPQDKISELHGNCYREMCISCGKEYLRGFDTTKSVLNYKTHITGRKCTCGGNLKDTIIHFTESLPQKQLADAAQHAKKSDIALVLGTSMRVNPAAQLPLLCLNNKESRLIIVNLQKTPYDEYAMKVHAKTDIFMSLVMKFLGIENFDTQYDQLQHM